MLKASQSQMKRAALSALSTNRTPPLYQGWFATIPTGCPSMRAKADSGVAVLLATHHMDEADALADRIVVIADGKIVADGPPAAIKAKVAGSTIRIRTGLSTERLQMLPGATRVDQRGAATAILTTNPRATLEALFGADPALTDIEVASATLEDALTDIVTNTVQKAA